MNIWAIAFPTAKRVIPGARLLLTRTAQGFRGIFKRPFSFSRAIGLMVCFGLLSPMVLGFIEFGILFDHRSSLAPWRFLALCLIIVPVLYGLTDRTQFRWDKRSGVTGALSVLLFAVSVAGSVFCYKHHVCMGGHLADDAPDLTSAGYAFDSIWAAGLVISIFAMAKARSPLALGFAGAAAFLISYRLVFGSFGGMYTLPI